MILTANSLKDIEKIIPSNVTIMDLKNKIRLNKKDKNIIILAEYDLLNADAKKIIKQILKIQKQCQKKKIHIGCKINNEDVYAIILNKSNHKLNIKIYESLEIILSISNISSKQERIEFIYDKACEYLDTEKQKLNYCDFKNDYCIGKRNPNNGNPVKMGCCYHVSVIPFKKNTLCKYLHNKDCTTKCFACKLFTCDAVKVKYKIKDIIYVDCFFNIIQKIILKATVLTSKEAIIKMLMIF